MTECKSTITKQEMIELREQGKALSEIATIAGITRQRVCHILGKYRVRKDGTDIEKIRYKGIYEFFRDNPDISFTRLANVAHAPANSADCSMFRQKLIGKTDRCYFTVGQIKRLIKYTHKSFEELFEIRDMDEGDK